MNDDRERLVAGAADLARSLRAGRAAGDGGGFDGNGFDGGGFDRRTWKALAEHGLLRMALPAPGTPAATTGEIFATLEGLGYGGLDEGTLFSVGAHLWTAVLPVRDVGTPRQRDRYLPGLVDGTLVAANATTEPGAGSDVSALATRAVRDGGHYVLDGDKTLITNAPVADVFVVYATLDPGLGPMGITAFLVDADTPGLHRSAPLEKMGLHAAPMGDVALRSCRVPADRVLGRPGRGVGVFNAAMERERPGLLAPALGVMRAQLEDCVRHARARHQSGSPIGRHQAVAHRMADMRVRLDASRALVYRAAELLDSGRSATEASAVAKLFTADAYLRSCLDALHIHGGHGYLASAGLEMAVRNAMGGLFSSGTADIQRNLIARGLGL